MSTIPPYLPYKRILLKLSGEILSSDSLFGINPQACQKLAHSIMLLSNSNFEISIVIGGGNIFRGTDLKALNIERSAADQIGMLGTLINAVALQQSLEYLGCQAKVLTALECPKIAETYTWQSALHLLKTNNILIFAGGTGNPYFTTDTAAALRASEIKADILLKATKVDGIYTKDPLKYPDAIKYNEISYSQILAEKLEVMDATAVALCRSNKIPILVFNMQLLEGEKLIEILSSPERGTLVSGN